MTESKTLLALMCIQPGEPIRADTVMARTGLSRADVGPILWNLCDDGRLIKLDRGIYALAGNVPALTRFAQEVRAAESAKRKARVRASKAKYAAKVREERKVEEREPVFGVRKAGYADSIVAQAMAKPHALHGVWGREVAV